MIIWFASDFHFGHGKIIEYCNRPFKSLIEMDTKIISNFNERVDENDLCFFLGDFCMKRSSEASDAPQKAFDYYRNQLKCKNIVFLEGNHDCFSEKTRLLTINGYRDYKDLKIGELIPTLNLANNKVEFQPIQKIIINPVNKIYGFKTKTSEGEFSSNHKLLTTPCNQQYSEKLKKEVCADLWNRKSYFNVPSAIKSNQPEYGINDEWLKMLGWIYTDGGTSKECNSITLYQSKIKNLSVIRKLLKSLQIEYKETIRYKKTISILGKLVKTQLSAHVFRIPSYAGVIIKNHLKINQKYDIPEWLHYISDRQMRILLDEMILGDGATNNTDNKVIWGQQDFLERIQGLCVIHGISCNLIKTKLNNFYLCIHSNRHQIPTREINIKNCYVKNEISTTWCVTVENHTLFTELNGKPLISCNSNNGTKTPIESVNIEHGGSRIHLTHNPKHASEDYKFNYTGHCHGNRGIFNKLGKKSVVVDLSVDCWDFYPVTINEINGAYSVWLKGGKHA